MSSKPSKKTNNPPPENEGPEDNSRSSAKQRRTKQGHRIDRLFTNLNKEVVDPNLPHTRPVVETPSPTVLPSPKRVAPQPPSEPAEPRPETPSEKGLEPITPVELRPYTPRWSGPLGYRSVTPSPSDGNGDADEEILPAESILTESGWHSLSAHRPVSEKAKPDQPAILAYSLPIGDITKSTTSERSHDHTIEQSTSLLLEIMDEGSSRQWSEDELLLVQQVTDQLSLALENARLFEESRTRSEYLAVLNEMSRSLSAQLKTEDVVSTVHYYTSQLLDTTNFYLALYHPDKQEISFPLAIENNNRVHRQARKMGNGMTEYIFQTRQPLLIRERVNDWLADRPQIQYGGREILSWLGVPMVSGDQVIGSIAVQSFDQPNQYDENDRDLLNAVANQAAVALLNARLFEQTQTVLSALEISERYQKSVAQAVAILTERGIAALSNVLQILGEAAKSSRAYYMETQVDTRGAYWRIIAEWRAPDSSSQLENPSLRRLPASQMETWLDRLRRHGYASGLVDDLEPELVELFRNLGTRSVLHLAVSGRHELPGCIGFEQVDQPRIWGEDEVAALQTAAAALSNTIAREDLFTQVQINLAETEALYQASARLNSAANYQDILNVLRQHTILGHVNASNITLNVFDQPWEYRSSEDRGKPPEWLITLARWSDRTSQDARSMHPALDRYPLDSWPTIDVLLKPERPTVITDIKNDPRIDEVGLEIYSNQMGAKSLIYVPLNVAGQWIGHIIGVYRLTTGFPEGEIRRLTSLSGQAAVAVQNLKSIDLATERAQESQQRSEQLALINRVVSAVASSLDLQTSLQAIATEIGQALSVQTSIALMDDRQQALTVMANYSPNADALSMAGLQIPLDEHPSNEQVVSTRQTLIINNPLDDPSMENMQEILRLRNVETMMIVPIISSNRVVGTFSLDIIEPAREFTKEEINLAETVVLQAATALENANLFRQTEQALAETEILYNASAELNAAESFDDILRTLVEHSALGSVDNYLSLDLFDRPWIGKDTPEMATAVAQRSNLEVDLDEYLDSNGAQRYRLSSFIPEQELLSPDRVTFIRDIGTDARLTPAVRETYQQIYHALGVVYVPLVVSGLWIGFVKAIYGKPVNLQDDEIRRLQVLASQAAVAAQNLRQVQQIQARAQFEFFTREINAQISTTIDRDTIIRTAAREICNALGVALTKIGLGSEPQRTSPSFIYDRHEEKFYTGEVHDVQTIDPSLAVIQSIPITLRGEVTGHIQLYDLNAMREWTENDLNLLQSVSDQMALSLDNARLFQETQVALTETETLYQASAELNATESYDHILQTLRKYTILGEADKLLSISIFNRPWLGNDVPEWLTPITHWSELDPERILPHYSLHDFPVTKLLSSSETLIVENTQADSRLNPDAQLWFAENFEGRSAIFSPLVVGGRWIGTLIGVYGFPMRFSDLEIRRLATLAGQAAVAISGLRLLEETRQRNEELATLNKITAAASRSLDLNEVLDEILDRLLESTGFDSGLVSTVDSTTGQLKLSVDKNLPEQMVTRLLENGLDGTPCNLVFQTNQTVHVADFANIPKNNPELVHVQKIFDGPSGLGFQAYLGVPLASKGRVLGTVCIFSYSVREVSSSGITLAEAVGQQLGVVVENARLFQETQSALNETEALYQASAELSAAESYNDILQTLRKYTLLGSADKLVNISLFNHPRDDKNIPEWLIPIAFWSTLPSENLQARYQLSQYPAASLLSPDEPTIIEDITNDSRLDENTRALYLETFEAQSAIFIPVFVGGQWIGHINAAFSTATIFPETQVRRLLSMAGQAAIAVQNRRLLEESQRRANQLQTAAEIARDTSSTLALDALLQRSVNLLRDRFNYYHATIFLLDESGTEAIVRESTGKAGEEMKRRGHKLEVGGSSVIGQVTLTGAPLVLNDVFQEHARAIHRPNPLLPRTRAELGIPLKIGERVVGALDVQASRPDAFTDDDISVLQTLADQIAVAMDNARSYEVTQKAVEEIREADRLKSQFLANMSHELRTPLNSIIGFSRVILKGIDGPINELQQQDLSAIYNAGQHLLGLINDVLDLSKIEAGKMELAFEDNVNLSDIIHGVMSTTVGLVKDKPIVLKQEIEPDIPLLRIDPMKIRQVLLNLLANAAKFTEEGSITTKAELHTDPDGIPEVLISIIDTGAGIAPEDQAKLFQPFSQVDGSLTRRTGGSGLGLSICHHLIRMHGGRIGLKSTIGQGSNFYFTLPLEGLAEPLEFDDSVQPELPDLEPKQGDDQLSLPTEIIGEQTEQGEESAIPQDRKEIIERIHPDSMSSSAISIDEYEELTYFESDHSLTEDEELMSFKPTADRPVEPLMGTGLVLAIDQDPQVIDFYRRYLSNHGYTVIAVTELDQVVTVAQGIFPSVITLDVAMQSEIETKSGKLDGWKVLKDLKSASITKDIPVIICSLLDEREKAMQMGASEYLLKPVLEFDMAQALARLRDLADKKKK